MPNFTPTQIETTESCRPFLRASPQQEQKQERQDGSSDMETYCCLTYPTTCPTGASTVTSIWQHFVSAHQQQPAQHLKSRMMRIASCVAKQYEVVAVVVPGA